jgi:hypothetical protein
MGVFGQYLIVADHTNGTAAAAVSATMTPAHSLSRKVRQIAATTASPPSTQQGGADDHQHDDKGDVAHAPSVASRTTIRPPETSRMTIGVSTRMKPRSDTTEMKR